MAYDEHGVRALKARHERRQKATLEERQVEALEQIADTLLALEYALDRVADNS